MAAVSDPSTDRESFSATTALKRGYERMGTENAWYAIILLIAISVIIQQTVFNRTLSGSEAVIGFLLFLIYPLALMAVLIVCFRVFVLDLRESIVRNPLEQDSELLSPLLWPTINAVIGSIIFFGLYFFGLILLVLPGVFVGATLGFFFVFVAVENDTFTKSMQKSWQLAKGNRLELAFMVFALLVLTVSYLLITFIMWNIPIAGALVGGFALVYYVAVFSEAFRMLTEKDTENEHMDSSVSIQA